MIRTGLDRLLSEWERLSGRRYGLLSHHAAVSADLRPAHLALAALGAARPRRLFGPEHGLYAVEQDMVPSADETEPATGLPIRSLYGDGVQSLRPAPEALADLDLLVIDLQDVGSRYYTYAATAVWAAEVALETGREVWVLDRPNPLGGIEVEGNRLEEGLESFVGAFHLPVRHGLTLGELVRLEARRRGWDEGGLQVLEMEAWRRHMTWEQTSRPWIAPSPNMPSIATAWLYPGGCLVEATELSEGRGTTRPFQLVGAPGIDPHPLADRLSSLRLSGFAFLPVYFRPQFQKHAGEVCGGVEIVVTDSDALRPYRCGLELLRAVAELAPEAFAWRQAPYEFVADRPAIDLLTGSERFRRGLEGKGDLEEWYAGFTADEEAFRAERSEVLLYD